LENGGGRKGKKTGVGIELIGRVLDWQVQSPEFSPQHQKKKKKTQKENGKEQILYKSRYSSDQ
jgi:hypothetical protein